MEMTGLAEVCHNPRRAASGNLDQFPANFRHAFAAWKRTRLILRSAMRYEDFQAFVRPMRLLGVLSGRCFLIALPPNGRIVERARNFRPNLQRVLRQQGYDLAGFTRYPTDGELEGLILNHASLAPFIEMIYRARLRKISCDRSLEDARDLEMLGAA
jgi:hypothetical protein